MTNPSIAIVTDSSARFPNPQIWDHPAITAAETIIRQNGQARIETPGSPISEYRELFSPGAGLTLAEDPGVAGYLKIYQDLNQHTNQIISLHSASAASPAYEHARRASEELLGRCEIQVIDSQTLSFGLGLLIQAAVRAAEAKEPFEEVVRIVRGVIPRLYLIFFLNDLSHLQRHHLVTRSQAILGNMLGVIAFLTMEEGRLIPMEKVRTRPRALEKLIEFVAEFSDLEHIAVLHGLNQDRVELGWLDERLGALHPGVPLSHADYGPAMGTLVGAESLGVVVLEQDGIG
jgi:fatty acid kinase fatty acid binding subunit